MKEVDIIPDDPKSSECIRQLEQVILLNLLSVYNFVCSLSYFPLTRRCGLLQYEKILIFFSNIFSVLGNKSSSNFRASKHCTVFGF